MNNLLRRVLRRLDDLSSTALRSVAPLGGHYRAAARLSQRGWAAKNGIG